MATKKRKHLAKIKSSEGNNSSTEDNSKYLNFLNESSYFSETTSDTSANTIIPPFTEQSLNLNEQYDSGSPPFPVSEESTPIEQNDNADDMRSSFTAPYIIPRRDRQPLRKFLKLKPDSQANALRKDFEKIITAVPSSEPLSDSEVLKVVGWTEEIVSAIRSNKHVSLY